MMLKTSFVLVLMGALGLSVPTAAVHFQTHADGSTKVMPTLPHKAIGNTLMSFNKTSGDLNAQLSSILATLEAGESASAIHQLQQLFPRLQPQAKSISRDDQAMLQKILADLQHKGAIPSYWYNRLNILIKSMNHGTALPLVPHSTAATTSQRTSLDARGWDTAVTKSVPTKADQAGYMRVRQAEHIGSLTTNLLAKAHAQMQWHGGMTHSVISASMSLLGR